VRDNTLSDTEHIQTEAENLSFQTTTINLSGASLIFESLRSLLT